jgi:hypothetical protein
MDRLFFRMLYLVKVALGQTGLIPGLATQVEKCLANPSAVSTRRGWGGAKAAEP